MRRKLVYKEHRPNELVPTTLLIYKKKNPTKTGISLWSLVILILLLLLLIAVFIASLFALYSRRPGFYKEDCNQRSCAPNFGLKCINSICQCPSNDYYYSTSCQLKKSFGKYCNNNQDQCKNGLICFNGKCRCNREQYWNGNECTDKMTFGQSCNNAECLDSRMLICDKSTNLCICNASRFWSDEACYVKRTFNEKCKDSDSCRDDQDLICAFGYCKCDLNDKFFNTSESRCVAKKNEDEFCTQNEQCLSDMICISGSCQCANTTINYFDNLTLTCSPKTLNGSNCLVDKTCRSDLGLTCQNGFCQCSTPLFWHSGKCSNPLSYAQIGCTSDSHCQSSLGLICYGYPTLTPCDCPTTSISGMCDCTMDKYWNGNICLPKLSEKRVCDISVSNQCSNGLTCDPHSSTCINSSACDSGWYRYNEKCYKLITNVAYTHCSTLFPPYNSTLAIVDSKRTFDFLLSRFAPFSDETYVLSICSLLSCPTPSSGDCHVIKGSSCGTHGCHTHDVLCEYKP